MQRFPFLSLPAALAVARVGTALLFAIHALVRIANGSIVQFGAFMESAGFPQGAITVWLITGAELIAAALMIARVGVRFAAAVLMAIAIGGIVLIHRHFGWFVGEHGTGGSEYSVALLLLLLVVAAADRREDR
jgi:putative oxidoreductase